MANRRAYRLNSIGDVSHCLKRTINELRRQEIDVAEARARGYLLNILLDAIKEKDFEQRIQAMEEKLQEKKAVNDPLERLIAETKAEELKTKYDSIGTAPGTT